MPSSLKNFSHSTTTSPNWYTSNKMVQSYALRLTGSKTSAKLIRCYRHFWGVRPRTFAHGDNGIASHNYQRNRSRLESTYLDGVHNIVKTRRARVLQMEMWGGSQNIWIWCRMSKNKLCNLIFRDQNCKIGRIFEKIKNCKTVKCLIIKRKFRKKQSHHKNKIWELKKVKL